MTPKHFTLCIVITRFFKYLVLATLFWAKKHKKEKKAYVEEEASTQHTRQGAETEAIKFQKKIRQKHHQKFQIQLLALY